MENYNRMTNCSCRGNSGCYCIVLSIIGALLSFAIGLIVGLSAFETLTTYFTAIVAIAIVLGVMFIAFFVLYLCQSVSRRC